MLEGEGGIPRESPQGKRTDGDSLAEGLSWLGLGSETKWVFVSIRDVQDEKPYSEHT